MELEKISKLNIKTLFFMNIRKFSHNDFHYQQLQLYY